jgi:hypothetical protein
MNLWARTLGQLAVLTVALFFFSCEDETSILGFKNPNKKFKVNYVDIPLPSDVFLVDSLRTSNRYDLQESFRLLAGQYADDQLGTVKATVLSQFFTTTASKLKTPAVFDSISLRLVFDFYVYGNQSPTPQTISVHELQEDLIRDSTNYYFNKSTTNYDPAALGSKSFTIIPADFKKYVEDQKDTTISVTIPLDGTFGQRIFDSALKYRDATTTEDSTFVKYSDFVKQFKGVAVVADQADKILGFSAAASVITLHYHDLDTDSLSLNLAFQPTVNYSAITADRSSTELAGLTQYSQPFTPPGPKRYIQAGTGVLTRLDFQGFYDFVDADSNATVVINSAELNLGPAIGSSAFDPVNALTLFAIKNEGYLRKVADKDINPAQYAADSASVSGYGGRMGITNSFFSPLDADGNIFGITKQKDNDYYNGFLTLFVQEFFKRQVAKDRFQYFALYPSNPQAGKSVNRMIFDADNIKLRIYYTRPTEPAQ